MKVRAGPAATVAAAVTLARLTRGVSGAMLRRGGPATVVGIAALRSPDRTVVVRDHDHLTGRQLDASVTATAAAMTLRWRAGTRLGLRGDGGIDFVVALAAAGLAGIDVMPIGPRHGADDVSRLADLLDAVVDPWEVAVRPDAVPGADHSASRGPGRLLMLSTGSGGTPRVTARGPLRGHALLQLADAERRLRLPAGPMLVLAPPDHGHGLTMVLAGLVRGRTVVLASGMRQVEQARLAERQRVATVTGVPAQLARLLDAEPTAFDGVALVVSGSSRLPAALRASLGAGGARVLDCYGSTEMGTVAIDGRPLAGVIIEADAAGRIRVTSPLGGGSPHDPGDRGRIARGRLVVEGRTGDLVDSGGELLSPDRIAAALRAVPGVVTARVTADPDDLLGARLSAEVTVSDPAVDARVLTRELTERVGRTGVPRELVVRVVRG